MTKKELSQYIDLQKEIEDLRERINEMNREDECSIVQASMEEYPYTKIRTKVYGKSEKKRKRIANIRNILTQRLEMAEEAEEKIQRYINGIEDSRTRQIMQYKYIEGWTWEQIGGVMGYERTSVEKRVNRYIKKNP